MPEGRPNDVPPFELTGLRLYIEASERQRIRLAMAFGTDAGWASSCRCRSASDPPPDGDRNR